MSKKLIQKLGVYLIIFTLVFYNFHRYIFQYNSDSTSPTYSNTPMIWKVLKYILILIFVGLYCTGAKFKFRLNRAFIVTYSLIFFILFINILNLVFYGDVSFNELEYTFYFVIAIPLWFTEANWVELGINYHKVIVISALSLFVSNAIVIVNYSLFGRLPALAYEGGLVRFGGYWDDPNGFGFICVILAYYFFFKRNFFLLCFALLSIFLTFSFTAYFMLFFSGIYWLIRYYKAVNMKILSYLGLVFIGVIYGIIIYWDYINTLLESKSGSVNEHLSNGLVFNPYPLAYSGIQFSETWYMSFLYNYFPVSLFGIAMFLILAFWCFKGNKFIFIKYFIFIFLFYCLFLPMNYVFPLNFIFVAFLALSLKVTFGKKELASNFVVY